MLLSAKGALRRTVRGARTFRGAFLLLFMIGFVMMGLLPSLFMVNATRAPGVAPQLAGLAEPYLPLMILGFCLLMILGPAGSGLAFSFRPAEVDFLFPAPFRRRELLIYKLTEMLSGALVAALFFSVFFLVFLHLWFSAFVGFFLTLALVQLLALVAALARQLVAESAYTLTRKLIWITVSGLLAAGLAQALWQAHLPSIAEMAGRFRSTWTGMALLAPFEVFSHTILAKRLFPDFVCWAAAAAVIDLGLLALVLRLDADYLEAAAAASQQVYEQVQRARKRGGLGLPISGRAARLRLPQPPWMCGAGPLAWRQLLLAVRMFRSMIVFSLVVGGLLLGVAVFLGHGDSRTEKVPSIGLAFLAYLTYVFTLQLPWAFRGDIDLIDFLKTLPVAPLALATGQLAGVLLLAVIQLVLMAALLVAGSNPAIVLTAAVFVLPFDVLLLATNNLVFLIYPVRLSNSASAEFQLLGRAMVFMLLAFLILIPALGVPAAVGGIAYFLSGHSWSAFAVAAWLALVAELPPLLLALSWTFERFDPSIETPA
jgi:hypothetical protein